MNNVELKAQELNNDMNEVKRELKRIASVKSRLKRQRGKSTYEVEMNEVLQYEELLKDVRNLLCGGQKSVPQYTIEDIQVLSYDETIRAIKSIQSKKSLTKWLTPIEGDNDEYRNACRVEQMLRDHKDTLQPSGGSTVLKEKLQNILDNQETLSKEDILQIISELV